MSTPAAWRTAMDYAASRSHDIVMYLLNAPDDVEGWAELARIASAIRRAAAAREIEEMGGVADLLVDIAHSRVMDDDVSREIEAALTRLLVLTERASAAWRATEEAGAPPA